MAEGAGDAAPNAKIVFVGNLPWSVKDEELKSFGEKVGKVVSASVFTTRGGRSKGSGLIEFDDVASAEKAVSDLHDSSIEDRKVIVRSDRGKGEGKKGGTPGDAKAVYIGNLEWATSEEALKEFLAAEAGPVDKIELFKTKSGRSKGSALVTFQQEADAKTAVEKVNGKKLGERELLVRADKGTAEKGEGKGGKKGKGKGRKKGGSPPKVREVKKPEKGGKAGKGGKGGKAGKSGKGGSGKGGKKGKGAYTYQDDYGYGDYYYCSSKGWGYDTGKGNGKPKGKKGSKGAKGGKPKGWDAWSGWVGFSVACFRE